MTPAVLADNGEHILYDPQALPNPRAVFAEAESGEGSAIKGAGRAAVAILPLTDGREAVVRHYRRGGWIAHISRDAYLWTGLNRTRPWREWHLLAYLHRQGLPVPRPLAARVSRRVLRYRGDLVTEFLPQSRPLAAILRERPLPTNHWHHIGTVLARFHRAGVDHADLNAFNILLNSGDSEEEKAVIHLIDFDRGRLRTPRKNWQDRNLRRLHRSLTKLRQAEPNLHFGPAVWEALEAGYGGAET